VDGCAPTLRLYRNRGTFVAALNLQSYRAPGRIAIIGRRLADVIELSLGLTALFPAADLIECADGARRALQAAASASYVLLVIDGDEAVDTLVELSTIAPKLLIFASTEPAPEAVEALRALGCTVVGWEQARDGVSTLLLRSLLGDWPGVPSQRETV